MTDNSSPAGAAHNPSKAQILLDLAASCERESPSREIDCHIAFFVTGDVQVGVKGPLRAPLPYMLSEAIDHPRDLQLLANDDNIDMIPRYTTSLDAAVTLVPEGFYWSLDYDCCARVFGPEDKSGNVPVGYSDEADAATPALALCAAALKARAAMEDK